MAKIRVYELAKELNVKPQVLLDKLAKMDVPAKSHVSALNEEDAAKVRELILGSEQGDEQLAILRQSVIRRPKRRKKVGKSASTALPKETSTPSDEPSDLSDEISAPSDEVPAPSDEAPVLSDERPDEPQKSEITESVEEQKAQPEVNVDGQPQDTHVKKEKKGTREKVKPVPQAKRKPKSIFEPAKIIKHAPVVTTFDELPPEDTDQPEETEIVTIETQPLEKVEVEPKAVSEKLPVSEKQPSSKFKPKKGKKPKKIREMPAKIIRLPEKPSVSRKGTPEPPEPEIPAKKYPDKSDPKIQAVEKADKSDRFDPDKKKKKWKKGYPEETDEKKSKDIRWIKKKISFKHKEVVEGDALYDGIAKPRKDRKPSKFKAPVPVPQPEKTIITTPKAIKRRVRIDDTIVLSDLAKRMGIKASEMIAKLMGMGVMATVNQTIDYDTAVLVAGEFNYEVERASFEEYNLLKGEQDSPEQMTRRPPVVTIMGHVDHGKTSLLDVIRSTRITEGEAGGITQHIGAYHVPTPNGEIVFLDTPGHEAFTAMRARGAEVTDIVILVVAADDGVMPQTVEAINHSKVAEVPIIVAVNKIDKANADPEKVYRQLAELGLLAEDWGGETIFVKVSAKQKQGIDDLLEMILLQSDVLELKANPNKLAMGYVVEAKLDPGRGAVATVLVQDGTLRAGDPVVCGIHYGKIRALFNDLGEQVESAGPSMPVEVIGLSAVPNAGDQFIVVADEKHAKQVSLHRIQKQRSLELAKTTRLSLDKLFEKMKQGEVKDLNIVIKADVQGSIEALRDSLTKLSNAEVSINVIHDGTGAINESDVSLAAVSDAIIVGFNVRPTPKALNLAQEEHVDIRYYNIIYNVIKEVQDAIVGLMSSTFEERTLGRVEIRETFSIPKLGTIAGCYVTEGKVQRGCSVRLVRDGVVIYNGKIGSLRRFKDDAKEVQNGYECGIGVEHYNDIKVGDVLECYYLEEIKPNIESSKS